MAHVGQKVALGAVGGLGGLLCLLQFFLRLLAFGDVLYGTDHPKRLALLIEEDFRLAVNDTHLTVRQDYAMIEIVGPVLVKGPVYSFPEQIPVFGMHYLQQLIESGDELFRFVAVDAVDLVGPGKLVGYQIPLPVADPGHPLRLRQASLASAQSFLGPLPLDYSPELDADLGQRF